MNIKRELQAVIFDLDGVITDTAEFHYKAWKALADELNIEFTREFNENLKGVSRMDSLQLLLGQSTSPLSYTPEQLEELADRKNKLYQTMVETITPGDILPGIPELLEEIRNRDIKIGLASASKNALTVIRHLGLEKKFNVITDVSKIVNNKPDPEIFLKTAESLGVEPANCIGVEDAVSGVHAIKAANMFAVAIGAKEAFPHADIVVEDTSSLKLQAIVDSYSKQI